MTGGLNTKAWRLASGSLAPLDEQLPATSFSGWFSTFLCSVSWHDLVHGRKEEAGIRYGVKTENVFNPGGGARVTSQGKFVLKTVID